MSLIEGRCWWDDMGNIGLALQKASVDAIIHGNQSNPTKAVGVCVALAEDCSLLIVVKDAGSGFDPSKLPNPVIGQNLLSTHGRGIFLINQLMDDVRFSFEQGTAIYMRRSSFTLAPTETANSDSSHAQKDEQGKDGR